MEQTFKCLHSIYAFIIMICGGATERRLFEKAHVGFDESFAIQSVALISKTECLLKCKVQPACQDIAWVGVGESDTICTLLRSGSVLPLGEATMYISVEVDGQWTPWSAYSPCSKTCGGGLHLRTRTCTSPSPMYGGVGCHGDSATTLVCNQQPCPVDGHWSDWSAYGPCSRSCNGGASERTRSCSNPSPKFGGKNCDGFDKQSKYCDLGPCPVNGNWSPWSAYGTCTESCGGGSEIRTRSCTNPAPQHGGSACSGGTTSSRSCNSHTCIDCTGLDGAWDGASITFTSSSVFSGQFTTAPRPDFYGTVIEGPCKGSITFPDDATLSFEYVKATCTLYKDDRNPMHTWTKPICSVST